MFNFTPIGAIITQHEQPFRVVYWEIALCGGSKTIFKLSAEAGGLMRKVRGLARLEIMNQFINGREIVPTQTVAQRLMKAVFHQAISTKQLNEHFAKEGRKADHNWVPEALQVLKDHPEDITEMLRLFDKFEKELKDATDFWRKDESKKYAEHIQRKKEAAAAEGN